jgi:magnesium and cobalt transporter
MNIMPSDSLSPSSESLLGRLCRPLREGLKHWAGRNDLKDALEEVIEEHSEEGKVISPEERTLLRKMLDAGDMTVRDVMIPRSDIIAVDYHITLTELKDVIVREQHTRMPVYEGSLDKLKGFIHLKDLVPALTGDEPFDLDRVLREVYFIVSSMKIMDLLVQMRLSGHHLAIVVDEYGGTDGLVTLEDLFEALVGEIQDEHDVDGSETHYKRLSSHQFELDARIRMEELQQITGIDFSTLLEEEEDYDSIAGFIFASLHRVPLTGEVITVEEVGELKILEADPRRIRRLLLTLNFTPLPMYKVD